jgi:hypothetical protein
VNPSSLSEPEVARLCEISPYLIATYISNTLAGEDIADMADGNHTPGKIIDGHDILTVACASDEQTWRVSGSRPLERKGPSCRE